MSAAVGSGSSRHRDGLPALREPTISRTLARLGHEPSRPDADALHALFRRWLFASPFHNLDLLAGRGAPLAAEEAVAHALAGRGGPCHVQAAGFASLLRALGYDVALLPATVKEPDDHLVVGVTLDGERWLCDVGNGHPYPAPFAFDRAAECSWFGWRFATAPTHEGLRLERTLPSGERKQVYVARWEPRPYDLFANVIRAHHTRAGFGPFMTGLRAVRFTPRGMLSLRDARYERHTPFGISARPVLDARACAQLLAGPFGLGDAPIAAALDRLAEHRDLFAAAHDRPSSPWFPDGPNWMLVTVTTTDRPQSLRRLLESFATALESDDPGCGDPMRAFVRVVLVENSTRAEHRVANLQTVAEACAGGVRVTLHDDGRHGRSIAASRTRQTEVVARLAASSDCPASVWMIDDDAVFSSLEFHGGVEVERPLREAISGILKLRAAHPEVSAVIGSVTGDPQVRPEAMLRGQVFDLAENLAWFGEQRPDASYCAPDASAFFAMPDYYYDHSRAGAAHLATPCPWVPRRAAGTVRDELLAYLRACARIPSGAHATRPLVAGTPQRTLVATSSPLRGGNAVFFDLDACLAHPYPCAELSDAHTRRSDMIGATLLARTGTAQFSLAPIALLHARTEWDPQGADDAAHWKSLRTEFHGVLLARLVMDGVPEGVDPVAHLGALAAQRASVVVGALCAAQDQLDRLDALRFNGGTWWSTDGEIVAALDDARCELRRTWEHAVGSRELTSLPERFAALRDRLLDRDDLTAVVTAWRATSGAVDAMHDRMSAVFAGVGR